AAPSPWPLPDAVKGLMGEDRQWDGEWQGVCKADDKAVVCELAIPWRTLEQAGLRRDDLPAGATPQTLQAGLIVDFSRRGRLIDRPTASFVPVSFRQTAASPVRPYTVHLHFAELRDVAPGTRVFDVLLQGKRVAQDIDVARQAGGPRRALTLEFTGIAASTNLTLELTPKSATPDWTTAPILNGLDLTVEKP
ncbi:MAG: hypothetical protein HY343_04325, partial [Lentisphaerae bacterium]|nr:hypothetical protein [Lentisphaerota bacterium]